MTKQTSRQLKFLLVALIVLVAVFLVAAPGLPAQNKTNERKPEASPSPTPRAQRRDENKKPPDTTRYSYEFTQPEFIIRHIIIDHDANGVGKITFERKGEETPIEEPINLSMGALGRVLGAWTELRFLESTENYQADKQFPHLGTMRLKMEREKQPLATPKLMDEFEMQMKRNGLSDPQQLVPLLNDISTDEHLPLIARNHALRLIKKLEN